MTKKKTFEQSIKKLEEIIGKLESGDVDLEKSVAYFTEGIELVKNCQDELVKAEEKVKILMDDTLVDFSEVRGE